jgi:hypothetical protein
MQYSSSIYLGRLDLVESTTGTQPKLRIFMGAVPASCAATDTGTLLVEMTLPSDWMAAASGVTKSKLGTWEGTAVAGSSDTPTHFRITNNAGTVVHIQGTCGLSGAEMLVDGTITQGQSVEVTDFTITAGNT